MQLFNQRIIARATANTAALPEEHADILGQWARGVRSGAIKSKNEVALHGDFKSQIVQSVLGYRPFGSPEGQTVEPEQKMGVGNVDLALGFFDEDNPRIIAPFELKGGKTSDLDAPMPGRKKSPVDQAWEYATSVAGVRWVLITNYLEIRLYSYAEGRGSYEHFDLSKIDDREEYARAMLLLSADNLLGERTQDLLQQSRTADREISEQLYADYRQLREVLIALIQKMNPEDDPVEAVGIGQKILDRILFIAFAEDTDLLPANTLESAYANRDKYNPRPVWENFEGLFSAIDQGNADLGIPRYNGGLFEPDPRIDAISLPDEFCKAFKKLGEYDFETEVGVTILGRIFEQSIADLERLLARARGEAEEEPKKSGATGRRKRDGIVYTPDYIARFIVERTLGTHLDELFRTTMASYARGDPADYDALQFAKGSARGKKTWNERELKAWTDYRYRLQTLRVVDPACGSGVFLVTAFDYLKSEYDRVNKKMAELRGAPDLFDPDSEILSQNLYGVDVNAESIQITRLSLWLKTARRGKVLDSLDHTIRVGDSLIEESNFAYLEHGFNWRKAFPEVFADGGFDVVLGNPPYVKLQNLMGAGPDYAKHLSEGDLTRPGYESAKSGNFDLYLPFIERGLQLLRKGGRLGYIAPSLWIMNQYGEGLRKLIERSRQLHSWVDFGAYQVFGGVTTYTSLQFFTKGANAGVHVVSAPNGKLPNAARKDIGRIVSYADLNFDDRWLLVPGNIRELMKKMEAQGTRLDSHKNTKHIFQGLITSADSIYHLTRIAPGRYRRNSGEIVELEDEIMKPLVSGTEAKRYVIEFQHVFVLFPYRFLNEKPQLIPSHDLQSKYPGAWTYLCSFEQNLRGRESGKFDDDDWYRFGRSQNLDKQTIAKLIVAQTIPDLRIYFDKGDYYLNNVRVNGIIPASIDDSFFLLSVLNSKALNFYFKRIGKPKRGDFFEANKQFIAPLPIPTASDADKASLAALAEACQAAAEERYGRQQDITRRIPDLCPAGNDKVKREADGSPKLTNRLKGWWELEDFAAFRAEVKKTFRSDIPLDERSDWEDWIKKEKAEIDRLSARIARGEDEINAIVYRLFELSDEEIALLEANI